MTGDNATPSEFPWPPLVLAGALVGAWLLGMLFPFPWPGVGDLPASVAGWFLVVSGVFLVTWGIRTLQKHDTTVMPHKRSAKLVTDGPFAFRRNPIYLGDVLILMGLAILTENLWFGCSALVFAGLVTWLAILPEEGHLEALFGAEYLDYKERVRRWI